MVVLREKMEFEVLSLVRQSFWFLFFKSFRREEKRRGGSNCLHAARSPLLDKCSVHSKAQHGEHRGADAGSQPEGGVLQVRLSHVPERGEQKQRGGEGGRGREEGDFSSVLTAAGQAPQWQSKVVGALQQELPEFEPRWNENGHQMSLIETGTRALFWHLVWGTGSNNTAAQGQKLRVYRLWKEAASIHSKRNKILNFYTQHSPGGL